MKITYLDHSGFAVEYKKYVLIFDWYKGKLPEFDSEKEIYVFSSHSHYDHFDRKIFELENIYPNVRYVLSADITEKPVPSKVWFVIADKEYRIGNLKVQTLHSTDAGVAFLVYVDDRIIYHAGDLNWWHWEEESRVYNEMMKKEMIVRIVTTLRQDALKGWISKESPVGRAVMGRKAGDRVYVDMGSGKGYYLQIRAIEKGTDNGDIPIGSF